MNVDVRGRKLALQTDEAVRLAELARAQSARSSRARDLAVLLDGALRDDVKRTVVLQRGEAQAVARLLRGHDDLSAGLVVLRDAVGARPS